MIALRIRNSKLHAGLLAVGFVILALTSNSAGQTASEIDPLKKGFENPP